MNTQSLHPYKPKTNRPIRERFHPNDPEPPLDVDCIRYDADRKCWWILSKAREGWGSYGFMYPLIELLLTDHKIRIYDCRSDSDGVYWTLLDQGVSYADSSAVRRQQGRESEGWDERNGSWL